MCLVFVSTVSLSNRHKVFASNTVKVVSSQLHLLTTIMSFDVQGTENVNVNQPMFRNRLIMRGYFFSQTNQIKHFLFLFF